MGSLKFQTANKQLFIMKKILSFFCLSFFVLSALNAQTNGGLDVSFDSDGKVTYLSGKEEKAYAMVVQPDGKVLVGGRIDISASICHFILLRYNIDGKIDLNFGTNGVVETTIHGSEDVINAIALQPDGKIVVAGTSWSNITAYDIAFARYNTNGTLDNTFGNKGIKTIDIRGTDDKINSALVIQPDGRIVAAGFTQGEISYDFLLIRLNTNGSLDNSFGTNGIKTTDVADASSDAIRGIVLQPDGKIIAAGSSIMSSRVSFIAARYSSNGALDVTFGNSGIVVGVNTEETSEESFAISLQSDGKIVSVGLQQRNSDSWKSAQLVRYNSNGTNDATFGTNGVVIIPGTNWEELYSVVLQPDGKIVAAGNTYIINSRDFLLIRLNANGTLDNTFGIGGKTSTEFGFQKYDESFAIARQNDGKILVAGYAESANPTTSDIAITRYNSELNVGIKESLFNTGLVIYPNPSRNEITVVNPQQSISGNSIVSIYNIHGQLVVKQPVQQEKTVIDISKLASGCYILKLNANDMLKVNQFVKE